MAVITIPYKPRQWALDFHQSDARWKVLVCHRRAGKTVAVINELIKKALTTRNARCAYIAPTYKQAKRVAWDMLLEYALAVPGTTYNVSELRVDFGNGSRVSLYGADNPDSLRGISLDLAVLDEYSQHPSSIFTEVIMPALTDRKGGAIWIGTPKGKNVLYRQFINTKEDGGYTLLLPASQSGVLDETELAIAQKQMSWEEYQQEFECSFEGAFKGAYYARQMAEVMKKRFTQVPYDPIVPVQTFWDLGLRDYTCVIFAQVIGYEVRIIDYLEIHNTALVDIADMVRAKNYNYAIHWLPHDVNVVEYNFMASRKSVLVNAMMGGRLEDVPPATIEDGINAVRSVLARCWFDQTNATDLVDALSAYRQEWDDKRGTFKANPVHDWASHAADAMRYLAVALNQQAQEQNVKPGGILGRPIVNNIRRSSLRHKRY